MAAQIKMACIEKRINCRAIADNRIKIARDCLKLFIDMGIVNPDRGIKVHFIINAARTAARCLLNDFDILAGRLVVSRHHVCQSRLP